MMRSLRRKLLYILPLVILFIAGCSKKESTPTNPQTSVNQTAPAVPSMAFTGPNTASGDPNVLLIRTYLKSLNDFMHYSKSFSDLAAEFDGTVWTRKFKNGSFSAVLTTAVLDANTLSWKLNFYGTVDSTNYDGWLALDGTSDITGKAGTWNFYANNSKLLEGVYSWNQGADGSLSGTLKEYTFGTYNGKIDFSNKNDGSGELIVSNTSYMMYKAAWSSDGSGSWWRYDSSGNITAQGTWK